MTEFYFVRHGETQLNQQNAFNGGRNDTPLTSRGRAAAEYLGVKMRHTAFNKCFASCMPRAKTTAKIILAQNDFATTTPIILSQGLVEMDLGRWDGQPETDVEARDANILYYYYHHPDQFDANYATIIGSETYQAVATRSQHTIQDIFQRQPSGKVLVVAHGLVFLALFNRLMHRPISVLRQQKLMHNAALTKMVTYDGENYSVKLWDQQL
jgi:probable phosphoglycerate mutase